jgi:hypothetical protein
MKRVHFEAFDVQDTRERAQGLDIIVHDEHVPVQMSRVEHLPGLVSISLADRNGRGVRKSFLASRPVCNPP